MTSDDPIVFVVDDDHRVREALSSLIASVGLRVAAYGSAAEFLEAEKPDTPACLVLDLQLPGPSGLELQRELADENFTVIGFPCNQFAGQEPGSAEEIVDFCRTTYGVSFPLSEKLDVNGPARSPVYDFLTSQANGFAGDITWNFEKFLISRDGRVLHRYPPATTPQDRGLMQDIAEAL